MDQQQCGDADREQAEADEPRPRIEPRRAADHGKKPQDDIEHRRRFDARQQRADRRRGLAVRVRQPRVHGHEADLGAEADEDEQKGRPQQRRRHVRRRRDKSDPGEGLDSPRRAIPNRG